jgi:hypothetical protein
MLDDNAQALMQALMARGAVLEVEARALYRHINQRQDGALPLRPRALRLCRGLGASKRGCASPPDAGFDTLWQAINKELSFLHLEMRRVSYVPAPGQPAAPYVGIVNRVRALLTPRRREAPAAAAAQQRAPLPGRSCAAGALQRLCGSGATAPLGRVAHRSDTAALHRCCTMRALCVCAARR